VRIIDEIYKQLIVRKSRHVLLATMRGMAEGMVTISGFPKTQVIAASLHTPLREGAGFGGP
jgi:hypothetical protein